MLGVVAFDALSASEAHIDGPPGREERRQRAHIGGWGPTAAEACGHAGIAGLVDETALARAVELVGNQIERLIPGNRDEARVLGTALPGICALHRLEDAVRIVELLHEAIGLDVYSAAGGVNLCRSKIRRDLGCDPVLDAHLHEVRTGDALIAVARYGAFVGWTRGCRHVSIAFLKRRDRPRVSDHRRELRPQFRSSQSRRSPSRRRDLQWQAPRAHSARPEAW